jgi:hypothetical protein
MFEDDEQFFEWTGKRPNGRIEPTGAYTAGRRIRRLATLEPLLQDANRRGELCAVGVVRACSGRGGR